ncbi:MAG TPA: hypothetical protein VJ930_10555 [Acidimicrobiia bacterium]|nr:hypothetical protein [Acidimicrobiia bacterium]
MILSATISTYQVRFRHVESYTSDRAAIYCRSDDERTQLLIVFYGEGEAIREARVDNLPSGINRVVVSFPLSMLRDIHHILQTEKPITLYANNNNDYTQVTFGTGDESVGEEEDGGWIWN